MSNFGLTINQLSGTSLQSNSRSNSSASIDKKLSVTCNLPHHRNLSKKLEKSENANEALKTEVLSLEEQAKLQIQQANKRFEEYCLKMQQEIKLRDSELNKLKTANQEILTANTTLKCEINEVKKSNLQKESAINLLKTEIAKGFNTNSNDRQIQIQKFKSEIVRLRNQMSEFIQHERDLRDELVFEKKKRCLACPEKDRALREALETLKARDQRLNEIQKSAREMTGITMVQDLLIDRMEKKPE
jgi:hypothetical protein